MLEDKNSNQKHTFLIVDDEPDILDSLHRLFRRDYDVLTAETVDEAFQLLEEHDVHIVMSDQRMPQLSGVEFLTIVQEMYPDCVRILFTGHSNMQSIIDAINSGHVYAYVTKPWDIEELKLLIDRAAERYQLAADRRELTEELKRTNRILEESNRQLATANRSLQDLDRMKTVFMELVSHELNTPIAIILGYTFLLQRELEGSNASNVLNALQGIHTSGLRLKNIADKIFKVLTSDAPSVTPQYEKAHLEAVFRKVKETTTPFLDKRDQTLHLDVDSDLIAEIDVDKITDAVINLVMNAIKFSPDGYDIYLNGYLKPDEPSRIIIEIIDQGVGISEQDRPKIFQTFFGTFNSRHHSSGDFQFEKRGIGLGLAIVKRFVEMHGGEVNVESAVDEGSTFTIELPRERPQEPEQATSKTL